jgi:AcrR family transcriptional regulator
MAPRKEGRREDRPEDRRVRYTRAALRTALVELMQDQHISGITVKSICALADVNRSTFYLHYHDQYDLLHQIEQEVLTTLDERLSTQQTSGDAGPVSLKVMTEILEYARENCALAQVLLSENCDFAFQKDIMELSQIITLQLDPCHGERVREYVAVYGISGSIALAKKWLEDGMIETPGEIAQLILQMLYRGASSF